MLKKITFFQQSGLVLHSLVNFNNVFKKISICSIFYPFYRENRGVYSSIICGKLSRNKLYKIDFEESIFQNYNLCLQKNKEKS